MTDRRWSRDRHELRDFIEDIDAHSSQYRCFDETQCLYKTSAELLEGFETACERDTNRRGEEIGVWKRRCSLRRAGE